MAVSRTVNEHANTISSSTHSTHNDIARLFFMLVSPCPRRQRLALAPLTDLQKETGAECRARVARRRPSRRVASRNMRRDAGFPVSGFVTSAVPLVCCCRFASERVCGGSKQRTSHRAGTTAQQWFRGEVGGRAPARAQRFDSPTNQRRGSRRPAPPRASLGKGRVRALASVRAPPWQCSCANRLRRARGLRRHRNRLAPMRARRASPASARAAARQRFRIATFRDDGGDGPLSAGHGREIPDEIRRATSAPPPRSTLVRERRIQAAHRFSTDAATHARTAHRSRTYTPLRRGAQRARAALRNATGRRNSGETFRRVGTTHRAARHGCDDAGLNIAEW
ncbi:Uncharacterised protein [Burkholderia oklahomensis]|nr:hypothetical protein BG90_4361 [Burkholderia oklahomensis C6786]SUY27863.1 Uncharacterised protein [Burkholderia oklahomensis]